MPKTLAEIAIEAGLVTKTIAAKAGKMAEVKRQPLVVTLIKDIGVDEVALLGAVRKATRVPLIDPAAIQVDPEALRVVPSEACARLRVLPMAVNFDGHGRGKVLRVAMADPTDTSAVAELESLAQCDIEVVALPLSAIDELVAKEYRQVNTAVVSRGGTATMFITSKGSLARAGSVEADAEVSVTAQIPISALQQAVGTDDLEARLSALVTVLTAKGLVTEAELAEALRKPKA